MDYWAWKKGADYQEIKILRPKSTKKNRASYPKLFIFNDAGYTTKQSWEATADFLIEVFKKYAENRKVLLTLDRLASHMDASVLEKMLINGINTLFYPAGSTFALQPADNGLNMAFKKKLNRSLEFHQISSSMIDKDTFPSLLATAEMAVDEISKKEMQHSFRVTGICPFDPKIIKARMTIKSEIEDSKEQSLRDRIYNLSSNFFEASFSETSLIQKATSSHTIRAKKNQCFTSEDLIENSRVLIQKKQKREQEKIEKQRQAELEVTYCENLLQEVCLIMLFEKKEIG